MQVIDTPLAGVKVIVPDIHRDARGYFMETYNAARYRECGIAAEFVQDNESLSNKGVVRGLHWQAAPYTQAKLVRVVSGAVYDVVVDIRQGSPTFGQYFAETLSAANAKQLFVPRGFAHGFVVLEDHTLFTYKCDNFYNHASERGVRFDDSALGIAWPDVGMKLTLSDKDLRHPFFAEIEPWQ